MGDARLAMCLADVGIKLSPNRGLYKNSILSEEKIFRNPCFAPYTFHHMNADMFSFANLLEDARYRPSAQMGCKVIAAEEGDCRLLAEGRTCSCVCG